MADDLPYLAEYAKSGRASCKGCQKGIQKDSLRLAVMVQSRHYDGKQPNWFHEACFFGRNRVKTTGDIAKFDQLRWEDQQNIKKIIDGSGTAFVKNQLKSTAGLSDFTTEYAKSSRSTCRGCNEKIVKDLVRIGKKDYEGEGAKMYGPQNLWYHMNCFVQMREELEFFAAADKLPGFKSLTPEDQATLKEKLPVLKSAVKRAAKEAATTEPDSKKAKKNDKEEKEFKKQSDLLFKYRDQLQQQLSKKELQYLLEYNNQGIPPGESRILDRIVDGMAFGALQPCKECDGGQLSYSQNGYVCKGNMSEWTKCTFVTTKPERKSFKIPDDLKEAYGFLKSYKYVKRERLLAKTEPSTTTSVASSSKASSSSLDLPLSSLKFVIVGKLSKPKNEIIKIIDTLGGKVAVKIDKTVAAVISTAAEVGKMSKKMEEAKDADVHVVSEDYLEAAKAGGAVILITEKSICNWGSDPHLRIAEAENIKKKSGATEKESMFTKSKSSTVTLTVKGGAAVDPDSDLQDEAHVLDVNGDIYNAILGLVDISKGKNSFYKLQILEADRKAKYWVFRAWGRVGTIIGGNKLDNACSREDAIELFTSLYLEKTGNEWSDRKNFVKNPGLFYPLDIDYGQDDEYVKTLSKLENSTSKLAIQIQDLIRMIFDVESMKKAMVEFELDLKKMPLGKLSRKQIEKAYGVLTELQQLAQAKITGNKCLDASNRFYTLIPHDFGIKKPTLLDTEEIIKQKIEMLDNLLEIEVAYNLLTGECDKSKDPIDAHYEKLNTDVEVLDHDSEEFKMIKKYIKNTHATTHNQFGLSVEEVFKVNRHGEEKRFKPFKKLHNRQLLWHGSRITNYAGILSQGLRIAPPEAPITGYMFGKGVYFADMVSKSANYCCTNKSNPIGLMLLCDVALGNMHELTQADFITKLPAGKHSTKGLGKTEPNPSEVVEKDGVVIPLGKGKTSDAKNTSLLYNEYIVYDVAQIHVKYLLKMKFNWRY